MKKIFVSVGEFRRGGGTLRPARVIYFSDGEEAGIYVSVKDYKRINVMYAQDQFPMHEDRAYVQIDCTPHYV